jgi:maltooligosyltrehalose trehalohydrolase
LAPPFGRQWKLLWSSNGVLYGGPGTPPVEVETGWQLPGECTVAMQAVWATDAAQQTVKE